MKYYRKFLIVILFLCLIFVAGCKKRTGEKRKTNITSNVVEKEKVETGILKNRPNHYLEQYETEYYLLKDGKTNYKLLVPKIYGEDIDFAINEFNYFFKEATGIELDVVNDESNYSGPYISLGNTTQFINSNIEIKDNLKSNGFMIRTIDENLYLIGEEVGVLNAVYELLSHILNYDFLIDTYALDKDVKNIPLMNYTILEIPDIEHRAATYQIIASNQVYTRRARMEPFYQSFITVGAPWHNSLYYLPLDKYYDEHPKWYAASKTQLSYCAQGDEEEYKLMVETVAEVMKEALINEPDKHLITLSIQDDTQFDTSDAQLAITEKYGAASASIILFLNDVNKIIREWFKSDEGKEYDRELDILFLAYFKAEAAPVSYNEEKGIYEGNEGIKCDDGVTVFYAPINLDYTHSIYDSCNSVYYEDMKKWKAISNNMYLWTYSIFYPSYLCPYNNFNSMQSVFQAAKECGVKWIFNESEDSGESLPNCYGGLKCYLEQKLAWDTEINVQEYVDKYFKEYYGEFHEDMKKVFNEMLLYTTYLKDHTNDYDGIQSCEGSVLKESLWQKPVLLSWYNQYTSILNRIDHEYMHDKETRDMLYKHVAVERLSPIFMLIRLYSYNITDDFLYELKMNFKNDNTFIGGMRCYANGSDTDVELYYSSWGIE